MADNRTDDQKQLDLLASIERLLESEDADLDDENLRNKVADILEEYDPWGASDEEVYTWLYVTPREEVLSWVQKEKDFWVA